MNKDNAFYYLNELETDMIFHIINEWNTNKGNTKVLQSWDLIPASMLIKEWQYNFKTGLVHNKIIEKIEKICIDNYLKLYINTILFGHSPINPFQYLESYLDENWNEEKLDEWLEDFEWFACDEFGNWKISDYAIDKIGNLIINLIAEECQEKKLYWIDQILNIVHQRSDIAALFIDGGSMTLNQLSEIV